MTDTPSKDLAGTALINGKLERVPVEPKAPEPRKLPRISVSNPHRLIMEFTDDRRE